MQRNISRPWGNLERQPPRNEAAAAARVLPQSPASPASAFGGAAHPSRQRRPADAGLGRRHLRERLVGVVLVAFSMVSIFTTLGIVGVLLYEGIGFFRQVSPFEFLTGTTWTLIGTRLPSEPASVISAVRAESGDQFVAAAQLRHQCHRVTDLLRFVRRHAARAQD